MSGEANVESTSLYDADYQLWIDNTVAHLQSQNFDALDLENLIEEIESLGGSDKRSLSSYLIRLCEQFFKLCYWQADRDRCFRGWSLEISNFRVRMNLIFRSSPSLKKSLEENFLTDYSSARSLFLKASDLRNETIPDQSWFTLEQTLDHDWLPWQPDPSDNN